MVQPLLHRTNTPEALRRLLATCLFALLTLAGCQTPDNAAEEPVWGKQPCSHCAMLLSERLHGAQALMRTGDRHFFDDVGCLVAWQPAHEAGVTRRWVRRHDQPAKGTDWLAVESARYARVEHTPMGFGFVAVQDPVALGSNTQTVSWTEVEQSVRAKLGSAP